MTEYTYNVLDLIEKATDNGIVTAEYSCYPDGSIRSLKNGRLTEPHTPYDALNQLNKVQYPSYTEELYYDRAGNRTRHIAKGVEELYKHNPRSAKKMKEKLQHNVIKYISHLVYA